MKSTSFIVNTMLTLLISFCMWEIASTVAGPQYFPHTWIVLPDFISLILSFSFVQNLFVTLSLSLIGFIAGSVCATSIAIAVTLNKSGDLATRGVIDFFRSIPSVVFLPLLIASIGSAARTAVILATFVVTFKLVTYVIRGIHQTETRLIDSAEIMKLPFITKIFLLYLPSTVSIAGTGMRLSASRSFGTIVASGIVAGTPGLGSALLIAESSGNYPRTFSYVIVMGIVGSLIYAGFTKLENQLIHWRISV